MDKHDIVLVLIAMNSKLVLSRKSK